MLEPPFFIASLRTLLENIIIFLSSFLVNFIANVFGLILHRNKITNDKWRKYSTPVDSRNLSNNVENDVVEALSKSVTSNYKNISHRYYELKSKIFKKSFN